MAFFNLTQEEGESFTYYEARMQGVGEEADLKNITTDDLYVYKYIMMVNYKELHKEFTKATKPTTSKLLNIALIENTIACNVV